MPQQKPKQLAKSNRRRRRNQRRKAVKQGRSVARGVVTTANRTKTAPPGMDRKLFQLLLNTLTLPHDTKPMRYPIPGFSRKTAVTKLCQEVTLNMFPSAVTPTQQPFLLCQSPTYPVWTTRFIPAGTLINEYQFIVPTLRPTDLYLKNITYGTQSSPGLGVYSPATENSITPYLIYVPNGTRIDVTVSGYGGTITGSLTLTFGLLPRLGIITGRLPITVPCTAGAGTNYIICTAGYNCWMTLEDLVYELSGNITAGGSIVISLSVPVAVYALMPAFPTIELTGRAGLLTEARVTSSSLLITNTTTAMYKGGTFDGTIVDFGTDNVFNPLTLPNTIQSRSSDLRYMGAGEKGAYGYSLSCERSQFMTNYLCQDNPGITPNTSYTPTVVPLVRLEDFQFCTAFLYSSSAISDTTYNAQNFQLFYDEHFESITTTQLFPLSTAPVWHTLDLQNKLYTAIADRVPVCENPGHWDKLKHIASSALSYLDSACSIAGMVASLAL
jgi:hypothetical protein